MAGEPVDDWEIWTGAGGSLALLVRADDPDKPWLTRCLTLKYPMKGAGGKQALAVFERALARGFLIPLPHNAVPPQHQPKEETDA